MGFCLRMSRILFAAKHDWTTLRLSRQLLVGSYLQAPWWEFANEKKEQFASNDKPLYLTFNIFVSETRLAGGYYA